MRLGHLANAADSEAFTRQITLPELAKLGSVEGRNLVFDGRVGSAEALPRLMMPGGHALRRCSRQSGSQGTKPHCERPQTGSERSCFSLQSPP